MFISLNFPVADFRGLVDGQLGRLPVPAWGKTDPRAKFVRGFGSIHTRAKSGIGYITENYYADCQNLVQYPELKFIRPLKGNAHKILMYPIYRRFFFDGAFSGRFEFGFRLNYPTINDLKVLAERRGVQLFYDPVEIAAQVMQTDIEINLLDGREILANAWQAGGLLREGYLLSSTKTSALHHHDIATVGPKYVSVGSPFVVIRSNADTLLADVSYKRTLFDKAEIHAFTMPSGIGNQGFDTLVIASSTGWNEETAHERLTRIAYTQLRLLIHTYRCYLDRTESKELSGHSLLQKAITGLLDRIKDLSPVEGDTLDQATCDFMRELVAKLDIDPEALASEIENTMRVGFFRRNVRKILGLIDRKSDVAISAASSTITEKMLSGF